MLFFYYIYICVYFASVVTRFFIHAFKGGTRRGRRKRRKVTQGPVSVVTENDWKVFLRRVNARTRSGHVGRDTRLAAAFCEGDWRLLLKLFHRLGAQNERRGWLWVPAWAAACLSLDDKHPHFARELEFLLKLFDYLSLFLSLFSYTRCPECIVRRVFIYLIFLYSDSNKLPLDVESGVIYCL